MAFSEQVLEEIQSKADIVEIVGSYIPLRRAGRNYKANCPFHKEKTPSFMVSPEKQLFHCFGCGVGSAETKLKPTAVQVSVTVMPVRVSLPRLLTVTRKDSLPPASM